MNKQQALKELTELRQRADALEAIINEPESYGRERVGEKKVYWFVGINTVSWEYETSHFYDNSRFKLGNYYHTREEAVQAHDRQLAYMRITDAIREQNKGWVPDWETRCHSNYVFEYSHSVGMVNIEYWCDYQYYPNELYGTKEAIEFVIKHHADDIKLYLGVE